MVSGSEQPENQMDVSHPLREVSYTGSSPMNFRDPLGLDKNRLLILPLPRSGGGEQRARQGIGQQYVLSIVYLSARGPIGLEKDILSLVGTALTIKSVVDVYNAGQEMGNALGAAVNGAVNTGLGNCGN
jgi:hypothetical protein